VSAPVAHLAQFNLSTLREPADHPASAGFMAGIVPVNAAGESMPGFVWRLRDDDPDVGATSIQLFPDPRTIVNLTVWESRQHLRDFAFSGIHRDFLRRRAEWFLPGTTRTALWWVPADRTPTTHHALRRLWLYDTFGATPGSFQFADDLRTLVLQPATLADPVVAELIEELNRDLWDREPVEGVHHFSLSADDIAPGAGVFLVAWLDGEPVGCGAIRLLGDGRAEVKRMFVRSVARGAAVGAAVLNELIAEAQASAATTIVLETGRTTTPEAVRLYQRFGFTEIEPWGEYIATADTSLCMALTLPVRTPASERC
jgi:GNAT superfamily N-acetyltransferase